MTVAFFNLCLSIIIETHISHCFSLNLTVKDRKKFWQIKRGRERKSLGSPGLGHSQLAAHHSAYFALFLIKFNRQGSQKILAD